VIIAVGFSVWQRR